MFNIYANLSWVDIITGMILPASLAVAVVIFLIVQATKFLVKCFRSGDIQKYKEKRTRAKTTGEALKSHRIRCGMTLEFVAKAMGVSRKAVLRWEKGTCVLSSADLLPLADLYGVTVEELQGVQGH